MSTWGDYVSIFVQAYRAEARMLSEKETGFLRREEVLPAPCQVEVVEFSDPFRLVLLFFFDQAKPDLEISFHEIGWDRLRALGAELAAEYGVRLDPLLRIFQGCRDMDPATNYAIDGSQNLLAISFPKDPRSSEWPLAKALNYDCRPQQVAQIIFHLDLNQAIDC